MHYVIQPIITNKDMILFYITEDKVSIDIIPFFVIVVYLDLYKIFLNTRLPICKRKSPDFQQPRLKFNIMLETI